MALTMFNLDFNCSFAQSDGVRLLVISSNVEKKFTMRFRVQYQYGVRYAMFFVQIYSEFISCGLMW